MTDLSETFDRIEQDIARIRNAVVVPVPDADDTPVVNNYTSLVITRDLFGDWTLTMNTTEGTTSGNFGPRPGNMLAGLFDYLRECGGGNWTAFDRTTGKAI